MQALPCSVVTACVPRTLRQVHRVNVRGTFLTMQLGARAILARGKPADGEAKLGGKIIVFSSVHGLGGLHRNFDYGSSKVSTTAPAAHVLASDMRVGCCIF